MIKLGLIVLEVSAIVSLGTGVYNLGCYDLIKKGLVNKAIKGETINLRIDEPIYRTLGHKIGEVLNGAVGERLAEKRFKAGKFDETIRKYRPDYNSNS